MKLSLFSKRPLRPRLTSLRMTGRCGMMLGLLLAFTMLPCLAASTATLSQRINPPEVGVGDQTEVTLTIQNGGTSNTNIELPPVDGLQVIGRATNITFNNDNGSFSSTISQTFVITASHTGDFTIPAFDIHTQDGQTLHVQPMKLHVVKGSGTNNNPSPNTAPAPFPNFPNFPNLPNPSNPFPPNGPVIAPPNSPIVPDNSGNSADINNPNFKIPNDSNGQPAKVFMVITAKTTDAYVGETIPLRIEFYIHMDVIAQQDSLPTIKGSDFLMNSLSVHPQEDEVMLMNEPYHRETWVTAISAPKNGDFPLQMERDTYWTKPNQSRFNGPMGNFFFNFNRPTLVHGIIPSNQLTVHVNSLPQEGRPSNFTGAIGQLKVAATAGPISVAVGEPVTIHFTVSGEGNFDYVKCPSLAPDPAWKTYVPASKIEYHDESHTQGTKSFEQAIIPQKNGTLPLPEANFSYFDPTTKQYVTVPVNLPAIIVTGSSVATAPATPGTDGDSNSVTSASPAPKASELMPNRLDLGFLRPSWVPIYRQLWFWVLQGGLILLLLAALIFAFVRSRYLPDNSRAEQALRLHSLHQEEDAMSEAVRRNDAPAFFFAARHTVQLKLGNQWQLKPEAITLSEIRNRDPQLAETLEPLFNQVDEVIYSGQARSDLNLAQWETLVRKELLQPQSV